MKRVTGNVFNFSAIVVHSGIGNCHPFFRGKAPLENRLYIMGPF